MQQENMQNKESCLIVIIIWQNCTNNNNFNIFHFKYHKKQARKTSSPTRARAYVIRFMYFTLPPTFQIKNILAKLYLRKAKLSAMTRAHT